MANTTVVMKGPVAPSTGPVITQGAWGYKVADDASSSTSITGGRGLDPRFATLSTFISMVEDSTPGPIVLEEGGIISAGSGQVIVDSNNKTIWGNTAPTGHINIHGSGAKHFIRASNIIYKHVALRLSDQFDPGSNDVFYVQQHSANGYNPSNVLIESCSFAFGSDETFGYTDNDASDRANYKDANVTFYKCMGIYPIRYSGPNNDPHNKHGLMSYGDHVGMIECIFAHGEGRPLIRAHNHACILSSLYYMWSGNGGIRLSSNNLDAGTAGRIRLEGIRCIGDIDGVLAYSPQPNTGSNYITSAPNVPVTVGGSGSEGLDSAAKFYLNDVTKEDAEGSAIVRYVGPGSSEANNRVFTDTGFDKPNGYDDRLLEAAELTNSWIDTVGPNPTTPDSLDAAAKNDIKNGTGVFVDAGEDAPNGGYDTTLTTRTHVQEMGQSLETWLENNVGVSNYHLVAPGYNYKTNLEVALESFVSGVPT